MKLFKKECSVCKAKDAEIKYLRSLIAGLLDRIGVVPMDDATDDNLEPEEPELPEDEEIVG